MVFVPISRQSRADAFEAARRVGQHRAELVPGAGPLTRDDLLEVEAGELQPGRPQAAAGARRISRLMIW